MRRTMSDRLKLAYHVANNVRIALRNAALGELYAEMRRLQRSGRVSVGPGTYGLPRVWSDVNGHERLRAGNYSSLNGTFVLGGGHAVDRLTTYPHRINMRLPGAGTDGFPTPTGDTIVGSDVWTAFGSLILSGVTIGDGAIVAAGAVVTKDVPPYALVGGNPAKVIRYRFDEAQREALLQIRWWDWPEERVREAVPLLAGADIDALIAFARDEPGAPSRAGAR
jgi:acetyltransferase-like isoleucine patch superfamily enzyme